MFSILYISKRSISFFHSSTANLDKFLHLESLNRIPQRIIQKAAVGYLNNQSLTAKFSDERLTATPSIMMSNSATKLTVYLGLLVCAAAILPGAESVGFVVGQQTRGYTGPFIGRYDQLFVGNPRILSYGFGFDLGSDLGQICAGPWNPYSVLGNTQNDNYDFNCVASSADITANSGNVGFYVGGLNQNGVTIAQCHVTSQEPQLCDSDTVSDSGDLACIPHLECS